MKLSEDGYSRGNLSKSVGGGVLHDHRGVVLAAFGSFSEHLPILFAELMAILEGLDLTAQRGFFTPKVLRLIRA